MKISKSKLVFSFAIALIITLFNSCRSDKADPQYADYPQAIGKIMLAKCATTGCHNDASKDAAGGLSMANWSKLFEGGTGSACVIPYRHDFSTLCYFVNTYPDLGMSVTPTMPNGKPALSHEEVLALENWIDAGAPNKLGFVKFSDNPHRSKFYVTDQGCDVVTVIDEETLLPMRYITVGNSSTPELPHNIKVSPDGQYWYVIFPSGNSLQKYRASDDSFVGEAILGMKNWNTITISNDGNTAYAVDWSSAGDIASVDLNTFAVNHHNGFNYPHASSMNPADVSSEYLYVSEQNGSNYIYKILISDFTYAEVSLYSTPPTGATLNSHEILFSPDGSQYFVTCQGTSEVRVMDSNTDTLKRIISVGAMPSEMSTSVLHNKLFVTCEEDSTSFSGKRGSVYIIDMNDYSAYSVYTGWQPHGLVVDDDKNIVMVANRNQTTGGPAPHHSTCGGRDGYITFIDMNQNPMKLLKVNGKDKKIEVSVDPYSIALRHY